MENAFFFCLSLCKYIYFFHLHCNTHDIPDEERDYGAPGQVNDNTCLFPQDGSVISFTDKLQCSGIFRDTLNQSSMVYGN